MTHDATDGDELYIIAADAALKKYEGDVDDRDAFWFDQGGDREDARQSAIIRAWHAGEAYDGSTDKMLHLTVHARFGILDYARELRADREKCRPARAVQRDENNEPQPVPETDLDGDPILEPDGSIRHALDYSARERDLRTDDLASSEVPGADVEAADHIASLRALLDGALLGTLENRERRAVRLYFGLDTGAEHLSYRSVGEAMGLGKDTVRGLVQDALVKLRAEFRVREIMAL